jgi:hypothetical protein
MLTSLCQLDDHYTSLPYGNFHRLHQELYILQHQLSMMKHLIKNNFVTINAHNKLIHYSYFSGVGGEDVDGLLGGNTV